VIEIAGYRISSLIGRGSTASVYHAVQLSLEREVAIKVLHPELAVDPVAAQRFLDEARLLAGLGHPHVVSVWDVGISASGLHYFSMRHLPGGDLASRIAAGPLDAASLSRIVFGIAKALGHIHARGLVHHDVTPGNILFDRAGLPYLTDFGVALGLSGNRSPMLVDLAAARVPYASPEQLRGASVDHRADLYSLGVVTYEALCGRLPFAHEDVFEAAHAHVFEPVPALPAALERWRPLIEQALAKLPEARIPSAEAFAAMVERCAPEHVSGLQVAIRAPHLEHIQTVRPDDAPAAEVVPALPVAAGDNIATQVSKRPGTRVAVDPNSVRAVRSLPFRSAVVGALAASVLLGVLWLWWSGGEPDAVPAADAVTDAVPRAATVDDPAAVPPQPSRPADDGDEDGLREPEPELLDAGDLDPALLPSVVDPVADLVRRGRALLAAGRLMLPAGNNAHDRFRTALMIDPQSIEARQGLADIGRAYMALATATATDALDERLAFWERGLQAIEGIDLAEPVGLEIARARSAERDAYLARGAAALARWDGEAALQAFELALRVDPGAPGAADGIVEAARVGKPGYRFVDALSDGSPGPELVVVEGFALATHPVTVKAFRQFWSAHGNALEGRRLSCRDRESAWRSSRRRTWEEPGLTQDENHPVVCVAFHEAEAFARWLSAQSGKRYRLPGSREWLAAYDGPAACAAANRGDQSFSRRHGGRTSWPCDDGHAETAPVKSFAATGVGLYDMDGNVREWSVDCVAEGRDGCRERLALGTAWLSVDESEPVQRSMGTDAAYNSVGFRVLREID
jgi:serine/threonine-protein kinase PpkA